ncbi:uncharacterized protein BT62DRAFT_1008065 [Guyanagaster necrorhizus]|uniref:Uncharacterized protein n=1 Tax=Guyanagaster necrorhizus TaxID=856835 RepID=A0A9P7VPN7_9AGAR|nr:uncharacterized protein BT62DRAFT_1008065 [Guyanagaster necrorhizus MCA 3950]KAG7444400.1 hypothetical protein BT62DRAFT_1008065 [Guyanagaster necrorhizus MCA 3950]
MPLAAQKVDSFASVSQPLSASSDSNSKTVVRLAKENARLNALFKTTQTKLDLLERFVRFLAAFGVVPELMEKAEQAMWAASTPMAPQSLVPQTSSSFELAVDRQGYRVKKKEQAPHHISNCDYLMLEEPRVVESIERLYGQFSGTDLGSLEGSNTSVESTGIMVEQEDQTPKKIKAPLTFVPRPPTLKHKPTNFRPDTDYPPIPVKTRTSSTTRATPTSQSTPMQRTALVQRPSNQTTPIQRIGLQASVERHTSPGHFSSNPSTPLAKTVIDCATPLRRQKSSTIPVKGSLCRPMVSSAMRSVSAGQTSMMPRLSSQKRLLEPRKEKENVKRIVVSH